MRSHSSPTHQSVGNYYRSPNRDGYTKWNFACRKTAFHTPHTDPDWPCLTSGRPVHTQIHWTIKRSRRYNIGTWPTRLGESRTWEWLRWRVPAAIVNDRPIPSSERMLHKNYHRKCSVEKKNSGRESQGACRQDELTGGKPPVVK
jgi:hypothetical protein